MTPARTATNLRRCDECLALLSRDVSDDEIREAAEGLGLSHWLPERQAVLPLMPAGSRREGQQGVKGS